MRVDLFDFDLPPERIALQPGEPRDAARLLVVAPDGGLDDAHRVATCRDCCSRATRWSSTTRASSPRGSTACACAATPTPRIEATLHQAPRRQRAGRRWSSRPRSCKSATASASARRARARPACSARSTPTSKRKARGARSRCASPFRRGARRGDRPRSARMPLPPYIAGKRAADDARPRRLPDHVRARGRARSPRRPRGCISRPSCSRALEARGVAAAPRDAACRRRHLPAGEGRRHRRPQDARRMGRARRRRPPRRSTRRARAAAASSRSAPPRCGCSKAPPARTARIAPFAGETAIFITPGYRFRAVDMLLTNFHLPRSTLFMLVAAFSGLETMKRAYAHAIAQRLSLLFLWRRLPADRPSR